MPAGRTLSLCLTLSAHCAGSGLVRRGQRGEPPWARHGQDSALKGRDRTGPGVLSPGEQPWGQGAELHSLLRTPAQASGWGAEAVTMGPRERARHPRRYQRQVRGGTFARRGPDSSGEGGVGCEMGSLLEFWGALSPRTTGCLEQSPKPGTKPSVLARDLGRSVDRSSEGAVHRGPWASSLGHQSVFFRIRAFQRLPSHCPAPGAGT